LAQVEGYLSLFIESYINSCCCIVFPMAKTLLVSCAALALKASGYQLSAIKPHDAAHVTPQFDNKPHDITGEQREEAMTGHHSHPSKWLAHHSRELIVKRQRDEFQHLALQHPPYDRFGNWSMVDICVAKVTSNLGGMGPDFAKPKEIRYHDIAYDYLGRALDLLITNTTQYTAFNANRNQGNPCFAVVNVLHGTDVKLIFSLVFAGTADVTTTSVFRLEDWDLDENGLSDGEEEIDVYYHGNGVAGYNLSSNNQIHTVKKKGQIDFIAEEVGGGGDNPTNMLDMENPEEIAEEVDLLSGAPQLMIDLKVNSGTQGRNYMFNMEYATTVTTTCGASCVIWGDPHVVTFDQEVVRHKEHPLQEAFFRTRGWKADQVTITAEGTYWLVKSENVKIQGRYEHNKTDSTVTNLVEIAVGGPFLKGNELKFGVQGETLFYNGQKILKEFPSTFYKWHASERLIAARYHSESTMVKNGKKGPGIDVELPEGMRMTINRWKDNLAVAINMCPQAGGQDGHCGNYNGDHQDDDASVMMLRSENMAQVTSRTSLFRRYDGPAGKMPNRMWQKAASLIFKKTK